MATEHERNVEAMTWRQRKEEKEKQKQEAMSKNMKQNCKNKQKNWRNLKLKSQTKEVHRLPRKQLINSKLNRRYARTLYNQVGVPLFVKQ